MNPVIKNILVFVGSVAIGMITSIVVQQIGAMIIPLPEGIDPTSLEKARESMKLLENRHFIMPFLSHFICCLVAGFFAAKFSPIGKTGMALGVGIFFLLGGIAAHIANASPNWFIAIDLILAYIPAAWIGSKIAMRSK